MYRRNQYIHLVKVLYCKLPTIGKPLPTFRQNVRFGFKLWSQRWVRHGPPMHFLIWFWYKDIGNMVLGLNCQPQRLEVSVLPLHHHGPSSLSGEAWVEEIGLRMFAKGYYWGTDSCMNRKEFSKGWSTMENVCEICELYGRKTEVEGT